MREHGRPGQGRSAAVDGWVDEWVDAAGRKGQKGRNRGAIIYLGKILLIH